MLIAEQRISSAEAPRTRSEPIPSSIASTVLWTCLITMVLADSLIGYFGRAIGNSLLSRPWVLIAIPFFFALIMNAKTIFRIKLSMLIVFGGLIASLLIGTETVVIPVIMQNAALYKVNVSDLFTISAAFVIGAMWAIRQPADGRYFADLLLVIATFHTFICVLALARVNPGLFPIIDSPYWRDGTVISRPEITTDQTRQVLYLFICLAVVFTQKSFMRTAVALTVSIAIMFIIAKVQSRWSMVTFPAFFVFALLMGLRYRLVSFKLLFCLFLLALVASIYYMGTIDTILGNVLWRFSKVDSSYGGRFTAITYLFEKVGDPDFWIPQGYSDYFELHGGSPHSFPTMIYLSGGILGLACYSYLIIVPLVILFRRVLNGSADGVQRISFFCASFAFMLLLTQPVITHEIFWALAGFAVGAISRPVSSLKSEAPRVWKTRSEKTPGLSDEIGAKRPTFEGAAGPSSPDRF